MGPSTQGRRPLLKFEAEITTHHLFALFTLGCGRGPAGVCTSIQFRNALGHTRSGGWMNSASSSAPDSTPSPQWQPATTSAQGPRGPRQNPRAWEQWRVSELAVGSLPSGIPALGPWPFYDPTQQEVPKVQSPSPPRCPGGSTHGRAGVVWKCNRALFCL